MTATTKMPIYNQKVTTCGLRFAEIIRVAASLHIFFAVYYAMIKNIGFSHLAKRIALPFKYGGPCISNGIQCLDRGRSLIHHFKYLGESRFRKINHDLHNRDTQIWHSTVNDAQYEVKLILSSHEREGDIALNFNRNEKTLHRFELYIMPGYIFNHTEKSFLFISGSQGTHSISNIKRAIKDLYDIAPIYILVLAAQAIATHCDLNITAVNALGQISITDYRDLDQERNKYDLTWRSVGGVALDEYHSFIPSFPCFKPIAQIAPTHRRRTKKKRNYRLQVYEKMLGNLKDKYN